MLKQEYICAAECHRKKSGISFQRLYLQLQTGSKNKYMMHQKNVGSKRRKKSYLQKYMVSFCNQIEPPPKFQKEKLVTLWICMNKHHKAEGFIIHLFKNNYNNHSIS